MNTSFAAWLKRESHGDEERASEIMKTLLSRGQGDNEEIWNALSATGDKVCNDGTFLKAAKQLLGGRND